MLEIPESKTLARQLKETLSGKTISNTVAAASPHGFAWYNGDPADYGAMLTGKKITGATGFGGRPEIWAQDMRISFADGVNVRYFKTGAKLPAKHQLLLEFEDGDAICCTVQMYGGLWAFKEGFNDDSYYLTAKEKPSPLSPEFDEAYFDSLIAGDTKHKLTAKAFLATEQRIPGLGNGVLQDILWHSKIHPKRKVSQLSDTQKQTLFSTAKDLLLDMTNQGGRDTEKDLFGNPGGYITIMSRKNDGMPCPACGDLIKSMSYLGGKVYVCENCQPL
jgi:formamidopyrimidine-DNA glycosylase